MGRAKKTSESNEAYDMPFPTKLRDLLKTSGETQGKLADFVGVQRQSIGQWKDGITSPDINALNKIADYYNVSADYLLGRTAIPNPDIDIQAIHKKTGLSDAAISFCVEVNEIAKLNGENSEAGVIIELNKLLESEGFWSLLGAISWLEIAYINKSLYEKEIEATNSKTPYFSPAHNPVRKIMEMIEGKTLTLDPSSYYTLTETEIKETFIGILRSIIQASLEGKDLYEIKESYKADFAESLKRRE